MQAYSIDYTVKGRSVYGALIYARDLKSAKRKIGRKYGYKDGRMIKITRSFVVGYF